jgi:DNA-binding GntR family transcriptional regulator
MRVLTARTTGRIYEDEVAHIKEASLIEPAPDLVLTQLGLAAGSSAIRRHRITTHTASGQVTSISTSWFAADLAKPCPALLSTNRIPQGTFSYIEEKTGMRVHGWRDRVAATAADAQEAGDLGISVGDPIRHTRTVLFTEEGLIVEFAESFAAFGTWAHYSAVFK